ncbi:hypothetical protein CEXT_57531 [Caerostris extrusa]|uniref:Uncharacterized protein n=1 Tax=Caerostris extrusa TaxID=172846 RepID=A0AAV4NXD4_CAEEX|nr:hypothetical protein CEXT_57531 [Caerostris extrusa]
MHQIPKHGRTSLTTHTPSRKHQTIRTKVSAALKNLSQQTLSERKKRKKSWKQASPSFVELPTPGASPGNVFGKGSPRIRWALVKPKTHALVNIRSLQ